MEVSTAMGRGPMATCSSWGLWAGGHKAGWRLTGLWRAQGQLVAGLGWAGRAQGSWDLDKAGQGS